MQRRKLTSLAVVAGVALAVPLIVNSQATAGPKAAAGPAAVPGQTTGMLPVSKIILESTVQVNFNHFSHVAPAPGEFRGAAGLVHPHRGI